MSFKIAYNNFSCIFTIKSLHSFQLVKGSSLGLLWYISCHVFCFYSFANPPSNPCSPQYRAAYLPALQRHCALLRVKFGPFPRPLGPTQSAPCSALILLYAAPPCSHHSSRTGVPSVSWTPLAPSRFRALELVLPSWNHPPKIYLLTHVCTVPDGMQGTSLGGLSSLANQR